MRIANVYIEQSLSAGESIQLPEEASRHVSKVLRMREGQLIRLFNGQGGWFQAKIVSTTKKQTCVELQEHIKGQPQSPLQITLAQGISRSQHMDYTLQKAVELGVNKVVPLETEHSNVKLNDERRLNKIRHWQKIIIGACEQSGRSTIGEMNAVEKTEVTKVFTQWFHVYCCDFRLTAECSRVTQRLV